MGDESFRIVEWNPAAEQVFGWPAAEVIGRDAFDVVVPPELRGEIRELLLPMRHRPQSSVSRRNENVTRDGRRIVCDWINTPLFDEAGRFAGFVSMAQDVTEQVRTEEGLRASEERYRSIVEATREGVWTGDSEGSTTFANAQLAAMLGCSLEDLLGRSFLDFVPAADREQRRLDFAALLTGEPSRDDIQLRRADGTLLWTQISAAALTDDDGSTRDALVVINDVTDQRALQAQWLQSQKMEALGRLAGGVAHDFNNVLTVIEGYGELLSNRFAPGDPDRSLVDEIRKAAEHAASLTRQLLSFSRRVVVDVQILDLNARIAQSEEMLRRLAGEDVELVVDLQPGLGRVRVDAAKLDQVLLNLVVNARDAMPRGGRIAIETADVELDGSDAACHPELHPGPYVRVTVRDGGEGIDPEVMPRIFEPFFTTKDQGKGTGLGLSTVYGIVKQFSGSVAARSESGLGATFEVYLPHAADTEERRNDRSIEPKLGGTETVLLVEDEDAVRTFERRALTKAGYRVLEACDGSDALALFDAHAGQVDVLVTDIIMPGMSGRELADTLLERAPGLPVLYVSGYTDDAVLRHGVLAAEASFLEKPFSAAALQARVRAVLDAAKRRDGDAV
jgi:PAS domain S-box-containing protein